MRILCVSRWIGLYAVLLVGWSVWAALAESPSQPVKTQTGTAAKEGKVEVKIVDYEGLLSAIKQHKGDIIVIDFWADY